MRESITKETSKGMLYLCNKCKQYLPKNKFNIDNTKGYSKDNVQLVCMAANQMKNDLSMEELTSLCSMILNTVNESKNSNHENN